MAKSAQLNPSDDTTCTGGGVVDTDGVEFPTETAYGYQVSTGPYGDFDVARSPIEPKPSGAAAEVVTDLAYWYQVSTGPYWGLDVARSPIEPKPSGAKTMRGFDVARSPSSPLVAADGTTTAPTARARAV